MKLTWQQRFWNKFCKSDDCWSWAGAVSKDKYDQYGKLKIDGKVYRAHRVSYAIEHNLPLNFEGMVLHDCDNPNCVKPCHLVLGDHIKNMQDMVLRGRHRVAPQVGEDNHNAKLTFDDVVEIRHLIYEGLNNKQIAKQFNVTHGMISRIRLNKSWVIEMPM